MRSIIEAPAVQDSVDDAREKWQRTDDVWDAVIWAVGKDPECGKAITESGLVRSFTLDGVLHLGIPTLTVLYTFDDQFISIQSVIFKDADVAPFGTA